jgi:hypothetical protein
LLPQELGIGTCINAVMEVWELNVHTEWRDLLTRLLL